MGTGQSPYLSSDDRLGDVIAAIQAMGTYRFYKLDFDTWADHICGDPRQGSHWRIVFEQHPEFFRLDSDRKRASLVWRRQRPRLYDVDKDRNIEKSELPKLSVAACERLSRMPLKSDELGMLVSTAISLHARALEHRQDTRWWITASIGFLGALAGGILTALITAATTAPAP